MASNPELQKAVDDIAGGLRGRPVTGIKGPIASWSGAYRPPDREDMGFVPNQEWDYREANRTGGLGMNGEQLPEDAKGWDAHGRPYYGTGVQGFATKHASIIKAEYEAALAREKPLEQFTGGVWALLKGTGRTFLDLLIAPSKATKRVIGTIAGLEEAGEGADLPSISPDVDVPETAAGDLRQGMLKLPGADLAAKIVTSTIPGIAEGMAGLIEEEQTFQSFMNRVAAQSQNVATTLSRVISPGIAGYNLARAVTAPGDFKSKIEAAYDASAILYTSAIDPSTRAEFMRRAEAGEDPGLLATELENPVAEFVGEMSLDPFNLWIGPGKAASEAAKLKNAKSVFYISDEIGDAIKTFKHYDEAEAVASLAKLSEASAATAVRTVANRAADLGPLALTTNGRRAALVDTAGQIAQWVSYNVKNPDDALELLQAVSARASGSVDEIAEATARIMAIGKKGQFPAGVLFSPASFDLGYVLREVMKGDPQKFLDEVADLLAAGDKAGVAEHAYKLFDDAAAKIYPDIAKRLKDGEDIGNVARALHKLDSDILGPVFKFANNVFSHIYMGMSPGYAARNALMDNFLIQLDLGPTNPFAASRWHKIGEAWQGGAIIRASERGISSPVLAAGVTSKEGLWGSLTGWGLKLGEKVERNSARLVVGKTIDRTMRQLLGKGLPTLEPIIKAGGMSDDIARFLVNTTINNFGDARVATNALRGKQIEVWKHLSQWADDDTLRALDGMGLLSHIEDSLIMSGNIDDALRNVTSVFDELGMLADDALEEMPTISRSNPALPDAVALTEAGAGDATKLQFGAVIESNNHSMVASVDAMNAARSRARNMIHTLPEAQKQELSQILSRYTADETTWGTLNKFATENADIFQQNISRVRKSRKPLDLVEEWDKLGIGALRGEPSAIIADVTLPYKGRKREFLRLAQDSFVDMKYEYWKAIREEMFFQADGLYEEMSRFMTGAFGTPLDDTALQLAARKYAKADDYARSFPFEDGLHYWRDPTPRFAVGSAGGETVFAALDDGIKTPEHFLNAINAKDEAGEFLYRSAGMSKRTFKDLTEVNSELGYDVLYNRRYGKIQEQIAAEGAEVVTREATEVLEKIIPPQALDGQPTLARAMYEQREAVEGLRQSVLGGLEASRGSILDLGYTDEMEEALKLFETSADSMVSEARILSADVATQTRDFILHDYRSRRNLDSVLGYVYPYQFWYSQTYQKMMQRIARNPAIASQYLRYKDMLGKIHAGAPDWWKYTVNTNELLGLDHDNPLYFNLEASLNPINGLTNVDFNDPYKRTSWFTGLLMDMNKFGPSTHTLYSLATAIGLYSQGEEDAANRWAGRIIPQTRTIKAVSALAFDKPIELDPWVALMGGGLDPYERNRVGRALAAMANEEVYTEAEIIDAANKQSGALWDEAVLRATKERAPGQISSFFLGVGFKGRTRSDIQIDKFHGDWHRLWEMEPMYSPAEMQRSMADMRKAYPFMDALMLSKKGGIDRDRAFAYNVLSRIPPSMSDDIAEAADTNPELLRRFYDDKGHMEDWPEQDKDRFMAGIADIAAVLDMPDNATKTAWLSAKDAYQSMLELGRDNFGSNIWELHDTFLSLMGDDPDDRQQAYDMLDANPRLEQAMKWKDQVIMFSPTLSAFYTSLDKIRAYYEGEMRTAIEEELGADIWDKWDQYNEAKLRSDEEARTYWKSHPELERYMDIKEDWEDLIATNIINVGKLIKPGPGPSERDILGEMGIGAEGVQDFANQPPPAISPELLQMALGTEAYNLLMDGKPYPPVLERKLEQMGFDEATLEMILGGAQ